MGQFHISQAVFTPNTTEIVKNTLKLFRPSLYQWTRRQYIEDGPFDKWLKSVRTCRTRTICCGPSGFSNIIIRDFPDRAYVSKVVGKNYRRALTASGLEGNCERKEVRAEAERKAVEEAARKAAEAAAAAAAKAAAEKKAREEAAAKAAAEKAAAEQRAREEAVAKAAAAKAAAEQRAREEAAKKAAAAAAATAKAAALAHSRSTTQVNMLMENTIKNICNRFSYG